MYIQSLGAHHLVMLYVSIYIRMQVITVKKLTVTKIPKRGYGVIGTKMIVWFRAQRIMQFAINVDGDTCLIALVKLQ